jgi:aminoglycoside 3-N-acetyltransferase
LDGKVLGLGVSLHPVGLYHLIEDVAGEAFPVPVRMSQAYQLKSRLFDGRIVEVPVTPLDPAFFDRRIDAPGRDDLREYFWREFEGAGLLTIGKVGNATSWSVSARSFRDRLLKMMREGVTIYSTPEELARRPIGP